MASAVHIEPSAADNAGAADNVYSLATLLSLRVAPKPMEGEESASLHNRLIQLARVPKHVWQRYDPKVAPKARGRQSHGPVTEVMPLRGDVLRRCKTQLRLIATMTGTEIREQAALHEFYVVINGTRQAVEEALKMAQALVRTSAIDEVSEATKPQNSSDSVEALTMPGATLVGALEDTVEAISMLGPQDACDSFDVEALRMVDALLEEDDEEDAEEEDDATHGQCDMKSQVEASDAYNCLVPSISGTSLTIQSEAEQEHLSSQASEVQLDAQACTHALSKATQETNTKLEDCQIMRAVHTAQEIASASQSRSTQSLKQYFSRTPFTGLIESEDSEQDIPEQRPLQPALQKAMRKKKQTNSSLKENRPNDVIQPHIMQNTISKITTTAVEGTQPFTVIASSQRSSKVTKCVQAPNSADVLHPLPQRGAPPLRPPRILSAGLVLPDKPKQFVNKRAVVASTREQEGEEDPELFCYLWNRQTNRPKVESSRRRWGVAN